MNEQIMIQLDQQNSSQVEQKLSGKSEDQFFSLFDQHKFKHEINFLFNKNIHTKDR